MTMKNLLMATVFTMASFCGNTHASSQDELPDGFDAAIYVGRYHDLSAAFSAQHDADLFTFAKNHFLMNGRHEGREARSYISLGLPADFKEDDYLILHPDIATYASTQGLNPIHFAISHFLSDGHKEGRAYKFSTQEIPSTLVFSLPQDFDARNYLALNKDVEAYAVEKGLMLLDFAKEHYLTNGYKENREYRIEISLPNSSTPLSPPAKMVNKGNDEAPKRPSETLRAQRQSKGSSPSLSPSPHSQPSSSPQKSVTSTTPKQPSVSPKPEPIVTKGPSVTSSIGGKIDDVPMTFDAASTQENFQKRYASVDLKATLAIGRRQKRSLPDYKREVEGLLTTPFLSSDQKSGLTELLECITEGLAA
ncbi:MAG: hypothetical protein H2057_04960 [Alphaproteobacteria bacterium]|nr:hypothetical protein [Alphaproteobacteria bacterium]